MRTTSADGRAIYEIDDNFTRRRVDLEALRRRRLRKMGLSARQIRRQIRRERRAAKP